MKFDKIFVIGFNKTATSTFHTLFEMNGLTSQHDGSRWEVEDYQCFSDNGDKMDWKTYAGDWPNSLFILNLRPLAPWIRSRAKHCYPEKLGWGYPPRRGIFRRWINDRNHHHLEVLRHFEDSPERLILVDITKPGWLNWIAGEIALEPANLSVNEARKETPHSFEIEVDSIMAKVFKTQKVPPEEWRATLLVESLLPEEDVEKSRQLLGLYRNNFA
jgi:hypothetical protein